MKNITTPSVARLQLVLNDDDMPLGCLDFFLRKKGVCKNTYEKQRMVNFQLYDGIH